MIALINSTTAAMKSWLKLPTPTKSSKMPIEEKLNAWSHGLGVGLGIAALILLLLGVDTENPWGLFSVIVYGLSIILLFLASTCYHAITSSKRKHYFRIA